MSSIPLRQRTATEIVDAALQLFRLAPVPFIVASALIYVPWIVAQLWLSVPPSPTDPLSLRQLFVALAGSLVVYVFVGGVCTVLADDVYFDRPPDVGGAFKLVGTRLLPLLGGIALSGALVVLGFIAFVIPGIYAAVRLFCVKQAVLLEGASAGESLSRSRQLSQNSKRHILNTLGITTLLVAMINVGGQLLWALIPSTAVRITLAAALSAVLYPFFGIAETLLYYDTRIRREGFDVEYLASSAIAAGPTSPAAPV